MIPLQKTLLISAILAIASLLSAQDDPTLTGQRLNEQSLGNARFEIDKDSKTLLVITDEATNEAVKRLLEQIDKPVPHASINVLFLEVTHGKGLDMGFDITHTDVSSSGSGDQSVASSLFGVAAAITKGGTVAILKDDLDITLKALASATKTEVLSSPSIMTRNNEEAKITIGEEVPFVRNSQITDSVNIVNTVVYEDVGIILTVTPTITTKGIVEMKLDTEISTMTGNTIDISETTRAPTIAKRSATTKVVVGNGQTVVIGGLMGMKETETIQKVPILGSLPLIGLLFQRRIMERSKTELLIFLTPTVVSSEEEFLAQRERQENNAPMIRRKFPDKSYMSYLSEDDESKAQQTHKSED